MNESIQDLQTIPGVGRSIAQDLADLGVRSIKDLRKRDPERLYHKLCAARGQHIDRCVLYVFGVRYILPQRNIMFLILLKWWNWKDQKCRRTNKAR